MLIDRRLGPALSLKPKGRQKKRSYALAVRHVQVEDGHTMSVDMFREGHDYNVPPLSASALGTSLTAEREQ